jgi:hypothetical protein
MSINADILTEFSRFVEKSAEAYSNTQAPQIAEEPKASVLPNTANVAPVPAPPPINHNQPAIHIERKVTTPSTGSPPPREAPIPDTPTGRQTAPPPITGKGLTGIKGIK